MARALRRRLAIALTATQLREGLDAGLGDLVIHPIDPEVVRAARIDDPPILRSLDAIHLATAMLIGAELIVTYDDRLAEAAEAIGPASASRA